MADHKTFPKPGKMKAPPKPRAPKAKPQPKAKPSGSVTVKPPGIPAPKKAAKKSPKAGPTGKQKFKPVNEGLGTVFVPLTAAEIGQRGQELAVLLQKREQEVDAQAETRSAMKARLDDFDNQIHRLGIAIREKREERAAPGLFDGLDKHKEKPVAEDTMAAASKKAGKKPKGETKKPDDETKKPDGETKQPADETPEIAPGGDDPSPDGEEASADA